MNMKTKDLTQIALLSALICILAPWSVPVGPVPVTLATFAIYTVSAAAGKRKGVVAVLVYLLIGAIGLPVFSNFTGGAQKVLGVTGGYMVGYVPMAFITGWMAERFAGKRWSAPAGMLLGTAVLYAFGTAWFMVVSGNGLAASLAMCVVPFLPGDIIKIVAASLGAAPLRLALGGVEKTGTGKQ